MMKPFTPTFSRNLVATTDSAIADLPVNVPIPVLNERRLIRRQSVLSVPGQTVPDDSMLPKTVTECARGWVAEMESFDRF